MKMANNLTTDRDGKVTAVCVGVGESVMEDTPLVVIE
jgi:biotin carboxyl carrier protein